MKKKSLNRIELGSLEGKSDRFIKKNRIRSICDDCGSYFFCYSKKKNNFHTHKLDRCGAKINMLRCNHGGFPCFSIATHSEIRAFSRLYPLECRAEAEPKRAEASERVSKSKIGVGAIPCFRFELHQTHIPSRIASSSLTQEIR